MERRSKMEPGLEKMNVWLCCDPGHDDALAIILAGHHPRINLIGVSTVAGNQTIERVTKNALKVLSISGLSHVPVVQGSAKAMLRPQEACPEIHGETGLDGPTFPAHGCKAVEGKAVNVMYQIISRHKKVHLIATGPLTNVALLLLVYPEVLEHLNSIHIMGGAIGAGNTSPCAEWNIQCDPEAAAVVFRTGKVYMVPLEVTHTALATTQIMQRIMTECDNSPFAALICELLVFFASTYKSHFGFAHPPLHDPCAVALLISPQLFEVEHVNVEIETGSHLSPGRTVCDMFKLTGRTINTRVATKMHVEGFWDMMITAIRQANAVSSLNRKQGEALESLL